MLYESRETAGAATHAGADERLAAELLEAAMAMTHADAGHVQLCEGAASVRTVAQEGLPRSFGAVIDGDPSGTALWRRVLGERQRIVIPNLFDARRGASISEDTLRALGFHATQTSPIITSAGDLVGLLSTHARRPRWFTDEDLARLDQLIQRAADFLSHPERPDDDLPPRRVQLDLRAVVGDALDVMTPQIRASGQELTVCLGADPAWIAGDHRRLVSVFSSLLRNAVTHTPAGGKLSVFFRVGVGSVSVHVSDNGDGISKRSIDRIFARRSPELDGQRRAPASLSLADARRLIELHDGELVAHSDGPGYGSRFVVRLPKAPA